MTGIRDEARVRYRAVADFADLIKKGRQARATVEALKKEEQAYNKAAKDSDKSTKNQSKAFRDKAKATFAAAKATRQNAKAVKEKSASLKDSVVATENLEKSEKRATKTESTLTAAVKKAAREHESKIRTLKKTEEAVDENARTMRRFAINIDVANFRLRKMDGWLTRLRNFRPRLIPPFIALIPIIGALLALINPLVAGLGAVGVATYGLASSLGLAAGSAVVLIPAISTLVGLITSLMLAFNGVGDAISSGLSGDMEKFTESMEKLSPAARSFVNETLRVAPAWRKVQQAVQNSFFTEFAGSMTALTRAAPALQTALSAIATALGNVAAKGARMVSSGPWTRDFVIIGEQSATALRIIGDGILFLMTAFKDVSVAAGPFLERLANGFRQGASNFALLVAEGRRSGSLASYLDRAGDSLAQWWRIAKNITATLVNYASAAREFNQWTTDGFENLSESWRNASREARREGSPYKEYLDEIRPLLIETRGLFGDFFRWFKKQSMDSGNISAMQNLIHLIRDQLGPALGGVLETLADSGIGDALVRALSSIVGAIDDFLQHGGAEAFKSFWEITVGIFEFFGSVIKALPMGLVQTLATTLAIISALKFFGIYDLAKWLGLMLAKAGAVNAFSAAIARMTTQFTILQRATNVAGTGGVFASITNGARAAGSGIAVLGRSLMGFVGGPIGLALLALGGLVAVFTGINQASADAAAEAEAYRNKVESLTDSLDGLGNATNATAEIMTGNLSDAFAKIQADADGSWLATDKFDSKILDYMKEIGLSADAMGEALQRGGTAAEGVRDRLLKTIEAGRKFRYGSVVRMTDDGGLNTSTEKITTGYTDQARAAQKVLDSFDKEAAALQDAKQGYEQLVRVQQQYRASLSASERANEDFNEALGTIADGASAAEDRVRALKDAVDILLGGTLSAKEAEALLVREFENLASALEGVNLGFVGANGEFDLATEGGLELHDSLTGVRDGMYAAMEAAAQAKIAQGDYAGAQRDAKAAGDLWIENLKAQLTQAGLTDAQIQGLIQQYGLLPETVSTLLVLEGATTTEQQLLAINAQAEGLPPETEMDITTGPLTDETLEALEEAGLQVDKLEGGKQVRITGNASQFFTLMEEVVKPRTAFVNVVARTGGRSTVGINAEANGGLWSRGVKAFANGGLVRKYANGGAETGGVPSGIYNGRPGGIIKFAEPETNWEAYISGKNGQENRNRRIAATAVQRLGGFATFSNTLNGIAGGLANFRRMGNGFAFADGGVMDYGRVGITGHGHSSGHSEKVGGPGTVIEQLIVNNPKPEPASDTLPRAIRKAAYIGG